MLTYKYKIPDNQQFISILGEIKSMPKSVHKSIEQRKAYINFVQEVNNLKANEIMVLLYIYDQSFCLFKDEINYMTKISEDHLPVVCGYIPKLFYEDYYEVYNIEIKSLQNKYKLLKAFIVLIIAIFIPTIGIFDRLLSKRSKNFNE